MFFRSAVAAAFALVAVVPAFAQGEPDPLPPDRLQQCTSDSECAEGSICAVPTCLCVDDDGDGACDDACEAGFCTLAEPSPPPACAVDADCAEGDVCVTQQFTSCGGSEAPCAPGDTNCDAPAPPPDCVTETQSYCSPPYLQPCEVDADCGGGFACIPAETCVCSGTSSPDGGAPAVEDQCECTTGDTNLCVLIRTPCSVDTDCAQGLVCTDENVATAPCDAVNGCPGDFVAAERICAPEGFGGDVRTHEEVESAQDGEGTVSDDTVSDDTVSDDTVSDDDDDADNSIDEGIDWSCAQVTPSGIFAGAGLLVLLRRRRS